MDRNFFCICGKICVFAIVLMCACYYLLVLPIRYITIDTRYTTIDMYTHTHRPYVVLMDSLSVLGVSRACGFSRLALRFL